MTRPDEIAALAAKLERASLVGSDVLSNLDLLNAASALRLSATSPGDAVREALKPFAKEADSWADVVPDDYRPRCTEPGNDYAHPGSETAYTVGDLRRAKAALAPAEKAGDDGLYVIRKRGYFYRPNAQGYTTDIHDAGRYSKEEAEDHARSCKELTIRPVSDYPNAATPTPPSADEISSMLAEFFCGKQTLRDAAAKRIFAAIQSAAHGGGTEVDLINRRNAEYLGSSDGSVEGHASVQRDSDPSFISKADGRCDQGAGIKPGPSDPAQEPQAVAWLDTRNEPASDWTKRLIATNPEFVENNGSENFAPLYRTRPVSLDREAVALDIADEFILVCEAAARQAKRTGNTFVLDRHRVANLIQAKLTRLISPASLDREALARIVFFASEDGLEYNTPQNDALWNAWKDKPETAECWKAADAILALIEGRT